jgi:hypothetical protein
MPEAQNDVVFPSLTSTVVTSECSSGFHADSLSKMQCLHFGGPIDYRAQEEASSSPIDLISDAWWNF